MSRTEGDTALRAKLERVGRNGHLSIGGWRSCQRCGDHSELIGDDPDAIASGQGGTCCDRFRGKEAIVKGD